MTELQQLLERWASLEPERCFLHSPGEDDGWCVVHSGFLHGWRFRPEWHPFHAQIAAQEAIEARHLSVLFSASSTPDGYRYFVNLRHPWTGKAHTWDDGSPAVALLAAYLNALEEARDG